MNARPILFSGEMVRAILGGNKTQTRRLVPEWQLPKKTYDNSEFMSVAQRDRRYGFGVFGKTEVECMNNYNAEHGGQYWCLCPFGKPGDLLYVRETWFQKGRYVMPSWPDADADDSFWSGSKTIQYSAEGSSPESREDGRAVWRKRPSIHMPRWASRITLRITNVRVERLQDISAADAAAEGCDKPDLPKAVSGVAGDFVADERTSFAILWNRINGPSAWSSNPWVWVIEFEVIKANVDDVLKQMEAA